MAPHLMARQEHDLTDDVVDVQPLSMGVGPPAERANPSYHLRRPVAIRHDAGERFPDAVDVGVVRG